MKTREGSIERNGFNLKYVREGAGEPVLVIGSRLFYQRLFSPTLKQQLDFVVADHRGFSIPPETEQSPKELYTLEEITEDIEALRKELNWKRFWIVGHSGHGYMALDYAKKYPDQVKGVILIGMGTSLSTENHALADLHFDTLAEPERVAALRSGMEALAAAVEAEPEKAFLHFNLAQAPKSWMNLETDVAAFWEGVYTNMPAIDYLWGEVFRDIDITKGLNDFYTPVWLAIGKYDYLAGPADQWTPLTKQFSDLTIKIFEHSSHNPPYEEAALFDQKLFEWMELYQ